MNTRNDLDLFWFFGVIYRRRRLVIGLILFGLAVAAGVMWIVPSTYQATTTLLIQPSENTQTSEINALMAGERLALTYGQIINSRIILEKVISQNNLDVSTTEMSSNLIVQPVRDTQLLRVSFTDPSPEQAALIANSVASTFVNYIEDLYAEQYRQSLQDAQGNIDAKKAEIERTKAKIDQGNIRKTDVETELTRLDMLVTENREDYKTRQENVQELELTVAKLADWIHVVEPAQVISAVDTPPYIARLSMLFNQDVISGGGGFSNPQSNLFPTGLGTMLVRETVLQDVIDELKLQESAKSLQNRVTVAPLAGTEILQFTVRDEKADQAVLIADTVAKHFIQRTLDTLAEPYNNRLADLTNQMDALNVELDGIQEQIKENSRLKNQVDLELSGLQTDLSTQNSDLRALQNALDQLNLEAKKSASSVVIAEPASLPEHPVQNRILYTLLALIVTFFLSIGLAVLLEFLDDKLITQEDVASLLGNDATGVIGHINRDEDELLNGPNRSTYVAEDFKKLGSAILPRVIDIPLRRILITSPNPEEGKSIVAANLAISLSRSGKQVILVDADFRLPRLHQLFGLEPAEGLSSVVNRPFGEEMLLPIAEKNLRLLPCGRIPEDPDEMLNSQALKEVFDRLSERADLVIVDTPPMLALADVSYLYPLVDGALLVIRSGHTDRKSLKRALAALQKSNLAYIGVILNDVYGHRNGYYKGYGYGPENRRRPLSLQAIDLGKTIWKDTDRWVKCRLKSAAGANSRKKPS